MGAWLLGCYAVLVFVLAACAGFVALFVEDQDRRRTAYDVLTLVLARATGGAAVFAAALALHQAGLW